MEGRRLCPKRRARKARRVVVRVRGVVSKRNSLAELWWSCCPCWASWLCCSEFPAVGWGSGRCAGAEASGVIGRSWGPGMADWLRYGTTHLVLSLELNAPKTRAGLQNGFSIPGLESSAYDAFRKEPRLCRARLCAVGGVMRYLSGAYPTLCTGAFETWPDSPLPGRRLLRFQP